MNDGTQHYVLSNERNWIHGDNFQEIMWLVVVVVRKLNKLFIVLY